MVRLVFRPYTRVRRSICTSESLRASTRVSPGFTLLKHSSPSFGSQHACSHSDRSPEGLRPADCAMLAPPSIPATVTFIPHRRSPNSPVLAHMLDSLVRVSRRGKENHFVHRRPVDIQPLQQTVAAALSINRTKMNHADHSALPASRSGNMAQLITDFLRFLFSNFRHSLTLFSKFFASFPHGTCTLSVSHQYLAFDGIYHRL
jgi:hypothetical protein